MPRRSTAPVPPDLRSRLEAARLDTLALLRAVDQAFVPLDDLPEDELASLYELDADCAEALWALDQPKGTLNLKTMVRDTLASLARLPAAREAVRAPLRPYPSLSQLEPAIRAGLDPDEAYNDIPADDPQFC